MTGASGRSSAVGLGTCSGQTERSKRTFPELVAAYGLRARTSLSGDARDDLDQFVYAVTLLAGERDELVRWLDDGSTLGRPCN